jgi:hypothetical protein
LQYPKATTFFNTNFRYRNRKRRRGRNKKAEEPCELDEDEETRPGEMYDHHMYGRNLSLSIPEIERDHEDILMIQHIITALKFETVTRKFMRI